MHQLGQQVRPFVGEIGVGDLGDDIASSTLDLPILALAGGQVEQRGAYTRLFLIPHQHLALELVQLRRPCGQHERLQAQQCGLPSVQRHAVVRGDGHQPNGEV